MSVSGRERSGHAAWPVVVVGALLLALALAPAAAAAAKPAPDRFSLANQCRLVQSASSGGYLTESGDGYRALPAAGGAEPFRMQATDLGRYLLYGSDRDFLGVGVGNSAEIASDPSPETVWNVVGEGPRFQIRNAATDRPLLARPDGTVTVGPPGSTSADALFSFAAAAGCAFYPEVQVNATGRPHRGETPYTETAGLADLHNHVSAFEFLGGRAHCGRPWHPYGAAAALVDCPDHFPDGSGAVLENLFYGDPNRKHDPIGWPTFADWPAYDSLTHEQTYYRWLERAWIGGERLMVTNLVENGVLCRTYPYKKNPCNEMASVRLQAGRMEELQDYVDAQEGGPGQGWLRIVRNPFQARRVINEGKLAIVLGIENSELFGCTEFQDRPRCTRADVDRGLREVKRYGVRSFYPVHKFDNAFGGTRFDGGPVGAAINAAQFQLSGHFWEAETCTGRESDNEIYQGPVGTPRGGDIIETGFAARSDSLPLRRAPVYPPAPHCNVRGLTDLGSYLINRMIDEKLMVEVDHMSVRARAATLKIIDERDFSGVFSGHEWSDKASYSRILELGGMVGGRANDVEGFADDWRKYRDDRDRRYYFGWGIGPDANGLGALPGPSSDPAEVSYPFESIVGDVTLDRQISGQRVFDVNVDGTAHYGLIPDWVEDLRLYGGDQIAREMFRGSEAYLQTWERAWGVPSERCLSPRTPIDRRGLGEVRIRIPAFNLLKRVGQPERRVESSYRYCIRGQRQGQVVAAFNRRGRVAVVAGDGRGQSAGKLAVGDPARELRGPARRLGGGLWIERTPPGNRRFVYGVARGRITYAGVASRPAGRDLAALKRHLRPLR